MLSPGVTQNHNICPAGDEDWATFTLTQESQITLTTSGASGDATMFLRNAGLSQLEFNDDGGPGLFSFIDRTCGVDALPPGTYFVQIDESGNNDEIASYALDHSVTPCPGPVETYFEDFEGDTSDWTATGLWDAASNSDCASPELGYVSRTTSFYYGQEIVCNYNTGAVTAGDLTSPILSGIPSSSTLQFQHFRDVEEYVSSPVDLTEVYILTDNGATSTKVFELTAAEPSTAPTWESSGPIPLAAFAGQDIQIRFRFDSVDAFVNDFPGWFIDDVSVSSPEGDFWARRMGGDDGDLGFAVTVDGDGNVYTTGSFLNYNGDSDFDPGDGVFNLTPAGSSDIFVSKLDTAGDFVWARRMGGTGQDNGRGVAVDASGGTHVVGSFESVADFDLGVGTTILTSAGDKDVFVTKFSQGAAGVLPEAATLLSPGDGATNVPVNVTLDWNKPSGAEFYEVYLGTSPTPGHIGSTASPDATSFTPSVPLLHNQPYYWRIGAKNGYGETLSSTWSFTTIPEAGCPPDIVLANQTLSGTQTFEATSSATLGPNLTVNGDNIVVNAPTVSILGGISIGGTFSIGTTPSCP